MARYRLILPLFLSVLLDPHPLALAQTPSRPVMIGTIDSSRSTVTTTDSTPSSTGRTIDILPILTYDTDVGFGLGVKGFFLNFLEASESFDVIAFNSTKGERWYRFVFSVPDFELRQGTVYPLSLDVTIDYDKYLKNNFFGIGGGATVEAQEFYTKEPLEIQAMFSRGFSTRFVGQVGVKFRTVLNTNYSQDGLFAQTISPINHRRSSALTFSIAARYDSRDSYINPSRGVVLQAEAEAGSNSVWSDYTSSVLSLSLQNYQTLFHPRTVLAARVLVQSVSGSKLPVHAYSSLGGNRTLRGYPQDRFLGTRTLVANAELRFPIYWRIGGVLGWDGGRLLEDHGFLRIWNTNLVVGLRLFMDTFVVRADLGFSPESTGFYLNFGHLF